MSLTYAEARDEVTELVSSAWAASGAVTENIPLIFYDKLESGNTEHEGSHVPDVEAPWGLFRIAFGPAEQAGHGDSRKRYQRNGVIILDIHTKPGDGLQMADDIVQVVADAVEGETTPGGVLFRTFDPKDRGRSGNSHLTRVTISFEFDQVKEI